MFTPFTLKNKFVIKIKQVSVLDTNLEDAKALVLKKDLLTGGSDYYPCFSKILKKIISEVAICRCSSKQGFLKILTNGFF